MSMVAQNYDTLMNHGDLAIPNQDDGSITHTIGATTV